MTLFCWLLISLVIAWAIHPPASVYESALYVLSAGFPSLALPVLAFIQNIQSDKQMKLLEDTHSLVMEELDIVKKN